MKENKLKIQDDKKISKLARCLGVLSNEKRLRIILLLFEKELNVGKIAELLSMPQSSVSLHLEKLAECSWVDRRRKGKNVYYKIDKNTKSVIKTIILHFNKIL